MRVIKNASQKQKATKYRPITLRDIDSLPQLASLQERERTALKVVASVLPFRTNSYVMDELIDWEDIPEDPIFQLTFPQKEMLLPEHYSRVSEAMRKGIPKQAFKDLVNEIRMDLNPHPAGQMELNVPRVGGQPLPGLQHKYRETVLFFPAQGQTCHAYCTYCFRWAQFVGIEELKMLSNEAELLASYVEDHPSVTDVLFTGGDPMIMKADKLEAYINPLLEIEHLRTIRIGTKALGYWPFRFTTDDDADDMLRLFEKVIKAGKQLAMMAHVSHSREIETEAARKAIRRVQSAGVLIRSQAPLIRHVNDHEDVWSRMWRMQTRLGIVPYYMFVERDTGPKNYFEVPLARAYEIYRDAYKRLSGLSRTVRGPSMSATPGKVLVEGITKIQGERVFALSLIQGRNPDWVKKPFFAKFDPDASWFGELEPAFGDKDFFFSQEMRERFGEGSNPEED